MKKMLFCVIGGLMVLVGLAGNVLAQEGDAGAGLALAGLAGAMCLLPIIWFVVAILLAVWVYKDAEKRGMGGVLWLIVVLIAGIIGLIIYLIVRAGHPVKQQ